MDLGDLLKQRLEGFRLADRMAAKLFIWEVTIMCERDEYDEGCDPCVATSTRLFCRQHHAETWRDAEMTKISNGAWTNVQDSHLSVWEDTQLKLTYYGKVSERLVF